MTGRAIGRVLMATGSEATMDASSLEGILDIDIHSFEAPTLAFHLQVFLSCT
jgi:hypothetical protein